MKHEWERDWEDAVKLFDDVYPYYVKCRACGDRFDVKSMARDGSFVLVPGGYEPCRGPATTKEN